MWKPTVKFEMKNYAAFFALLGLVVISSFLSPHFMQLQNILNITRQISYTGIIALGMTFVIIVGGIDLSVGSIVPFVGYQQYGDMGMNAFLKIPVPTLVMFALSYVMSLILAGTRYGSQGYPSSPPLTCTKLKS